MDMCYDGALVMPSSYAVMDEEEMTYVEGGAEVAVCRDYLNKNTCLRVASAYTAETGLSQLRIAKEIYAHAVIYYASPFAMVPYTIMVSSALGIVGTAVTVSSTFKYLREHSNPINIGGDNNFRVTVYDLLWKLT